MDYYHQHDNQARLFSTADDELGMHACKRVHYSIHEYGGSDAIHS